MSTYEDILLFLSSFEKNKTMVDIHMQSVEFMARNKGVAFEAS